MKKNRNLVLWLVIALVAIAVALTGCGSGRNEGAPAEMRQKKEVVTVRAAVPADWVMNGGAVRFWAWKEGGEDLYEAWPGEELILDDSGWFTTTVPGWVDRVIVNSYDGTVQTADVAIDPGHDIWLLVMDDLAVDVFYEDIFSGYEGEAEHSGLPGDMENDPFMQAALAEDFETMAELLPTLQDRSILTDWAFNDFNYWYAAEAVRAHDYATAIEFFDYCAYENNRSYARIFEHLVVGDVEKALDVLVSMGFTMLDLDLDMEWSQIIQEAAGMEFAEGSVDDILWDAYVPRRIRTNQPSFGEDSLVFGEPSKWQAEGYIGEIEDEEDYLPVTDLNALYSQCGSEANGKILVIRSQKSYPQGSTYYAIDLPVMDYLGYDLYPASLAEVEYIIEVNYGYDLDGQYKQTFSSDYASVTDYFSYLRMKGQVVLKAVVGRNVIQQSQWIRGTGEVEAHFSDLDYQCSNMPETGADIISAVEKVRQLNAA